MHFPDILTQRFHVLRRLGERRSDTGGVWLVLPVTQTVPCVLKLSLPARSPDAQALERLCRHGHRPDHLALPVEFGLADQWFYQVGPYFPMGSLDAQARDGNVSLPVCLDLLRQLNIALQALHGERIIHGDVKPSNVFASNITSSGPDYLLADFDTAVTMADGQRARQAKGYTPRCAAPEVLGGGAISPAADYWSLGMLLLECQMGRHPLADLDEHALRTVLTTGWRPNFHQIEDTVWRALMGGLLERNPDARWGATEVSRWLERDPQIISAGLALSGESACSTPFNVGGTPAYSPRGLGQALLRRWAVSSLASPGLLEWLRISLRRDDLAALLEATLADPSLDNDLRLLHFCHALAPDVSPVWRGRALTAENLDAAALAAMSGDADSGAWLRTLIDGHCFDFLARRGYTEAEQVGRRFQDAWAGYQSAWDSVLQQGAPATARPAGEVALPIVVRAIFSDDMRVTIRRQAERLLEPETLLRRAPWYLHFGTDLAALSEVQLLVLQHLDEVSLLSEVNVTALDALGQVDAERLRNGVLLLRSQRHLLRNLVVRSGSEVFVLRPGDVHGRRGPRSLGDDVIEVVSRVGAAARQFVRNWRSRRRSRAAPPTATPELLVEARVVRLAYTQQGQALPVEAEVYLALVSWHSPESVRSRLHLTHRGWILPQPQLMTPVLPAQGQMLLLLTSDTLIRLVGRQRRFGRSLHTRPIEIRFEPQPEPIGLTDAMLRVNSDLALPDGKPMSPHVDLIASLGDMRTANTGMIGAQTENMVTADLRPTPADALTVRGQLPTRREMGLWAAFSPRS